jgi:hypothetical protein
MIAYNQFSSASALRDLTVGGQAVGGLGRKGAQRIIILETDGMANQGVSAGFTDGGPYKSYYNILPSDTVNSASYSRTAILEVAMAIANKDDGTPVRTFPSGFPTPPSYPGYSTPRKPVVIHTLAYGPVFEPTASGTEPDNAVALLQDLSTIGGTTFPSSSTDPDNGYKWCIGSIEERKNKLKTAFLKLMDENVTVVLVD